MDNSLELKAQIDGIQKLVAGAIILNSEGKVLLVRRTTDEYLPGLIEFPSGKVDNGETILQGLSREVKEETNLDVINVIKYVDSFDYISGSGKKSRQFNFIVSVSGKIKLNPEEHDSYNFYDKEVLLNEDINISKSTRSILKIVFNN